MGHVVNGLVKEETQFGDDAELMSYPLTKVIPYLLDIGVYVLDRLLTFLLRENAQIYAGNAQVAAYLDLAYRNHQSFGKFGLDKEHLTQFLLDKP